MRDSILGATPRARAWLVLRHLEGVGDDLARELAKRAGGPERALSSDAASLVRLGVAPELVRRLRGSEVTDRVEREIERLSRIGARLVGLGDREYPENLRHVFDPPTVLSVRGELRPEDRLAVSIVGSRRASSYGIAVAERLASELSAEGITVVSGLAYGIDAAAHRGALEAKGRTIAVLGSGLGRCYPAGHRALLERIVSSGAVMSELPFESEPAPWNFPKRNRIVSGLARAVIVVEADARSGSRITARLALEQGRCVGAVPGPVGSATSRGTHALLRDGALLVESARDVIEDCLPEVLERRNESGQTGPSLGHLRPECAKILDQFSEAVMDVDELVRRSGLTPATVLEALLELEVAGFVRRFAGMQYVRGSA